VGRYLVATRDLEPMELVLSDLAAASGPLHEDTVVCLGCLKALSLPSADSAIAICQDCGLPFCSTTCQDDVIHKAQECALFLQRRIKFDNVDQASRHPLYKVILILRLLLIRDTNPKKWTDISQLMDHREDRLQDRVTWDALKVEIVDYLLKELKLGDLFTEDEVQKCIGTVRINAIRSTEYHDRGRYRGVFPRMALLSNACFCNSRVISTNREGLTPTMDIRTQIHVKELNFSYNHLMMGRLSRRESFRQGWFFDCKCSRCCDATEMGSFLNALLCPLCPANERGTVLPIDPLDYDSLWRCDREKCLFRLTTKEVASMEDESQRLMDQTPLPGNSLVDFYEGLLLQLSSQFHPHHYLLMKIKSNLISQYGNVPKYHYSKLSTELVERKLRLCQEFLDVFGRVDPGQATDWWAVTQLEAIGAKAVLLQRDLESGKIPASAFKEALIGECQQGLGDVIRVLELEQLGTYCHSQALKAKKLLTEMNDVIRFVDFL